MYSLLLTTACIALGVNHCKTNEWMHAFILIVQCLQHVNFDFNIKCSHFQYFIMNYKPFYKYKIASLNFRFFCCCFFENSWSNFSKNTDESVWLEALIVVHYCIPCRERRSTEVSKIAELLHGKS